jgi:hypothetical protein
MDTDSMAFLWELKEESIEDRAKPLMRADKKEPSFEYPFVHQISLIF